MKNVVELRNALSDVLRELRSGSMDSRQASAAANIAGKMISSATAQLKMAQLQGQKPDIEFLKEDKYVDVNPSLTVRR